MENNEIIMNEEVEFENETVVVEEEPAGIGTGAAIAIGAGVIAAVGAAVAFGKKAIEAWKSKREVQKPDKEIEVDPEVVEAVATEA